MYISFLLPSFPLYHDGLRCPLVLSSAGLVGFRPYGLEEDVRAYEQDLAKRLYQARVKASQGSTASPQPPSSADSQLRSASRP